MRRINRHRQDGTDGSEDGRQRLSVSGRVKVVAAVALALLTAGVVAAYGAFGAEDTATGTGALASEAGGNGNSAFGYNALKSNTGGFYNTAVGGRALSSNTTGLNNVAAGSSALGANSTGSYNTAVGSAALRNNTADGNTATGQGALQLNATGRDNTAGGANALYENTSGGQDTAVGAAAGRGPTPNTTGSYNTYLGFRAAPGNGALTNATAIGANAVVSQSNSLVLGASGVNVGVNTTTPRSRLQIGAPAVTFGDYLQIPMVSNIVLAPPAGDCNATTFVGRLVLHYRLGLITLWVCSPTGMWAQLAQH